MPAVTNTEAANHEKILSSRVSLVRYLTGLLRGGGGNKGLVINTLRTHRFQARELASTLDERGWSSSGPTEGWMDTTSGEKLGKSPERRIIWFGQVSFSDRVSGKDARYEGAGNYRGGVSLHGS